MSRFEGLGEWYDGVMTDPGARGGLGEQANALIAELAGPGKGVALDIGCGTGLAAAALRARGYRPVGVDLAFDQLRIGRERLPVVQGDAARLPIAGGAVDLAYSTFVSSDLDDFAGAAAEAFRVVRPGGRYLTVCVHPVLNSSHTVKREDGTVIVTPGYRETGYREPEAFASAVRSRVGAWHRPLDETLNVFLRTGFSLLQVREGGPSPLPDFLALELLRP